LEIFPSDMSGVNYLTGTGYEVLTALVMDSYFNGILSRVVRRKSTDVSEEHVASVFQMIELLII
jgi:hypothetical protein